MLKSPKQRTSDMRMCKQLRCFINNEKREAKQNQQQQKQQRYVMRQHNDNMPSSQ